MNAALGADRVDFGLNPCFSHRRKFRRFDLVKRVQKLSNGLLAQRLPKKLLHCGLIQESRVPNLIGEFVRKFYGEFSHVGDLC